MSAEKGHYENEVELTRGKPQEPEAALYADDEGGLSTKGIAMLALYSAAWGSGIRMRDLERLYPSFGWSFWDIRRSPDVAADWCSMA